MPEMCEGADLPGGGKFELRAYQTDAIKEKEKLNKSMNQKGGMLGYMNLSSYFGAGGGANN